MAVKIRLARHGAKKKPFYRIVVADSESPRDGRFLENVGTYDPAYDPARITIKTDRVRYWMDQGALPRVNQAGEKGCRRPELERDPTAALYLQQREHMRPGVRCALADQLLNARALQVLQGL